MVAKNAQHLARIINDAYKRATKLDAGQLRVLGEFAGTVIKARTKKGISSTGKAFAPYSDSYAEQRAERGLATASRDLTRTGHMLGAITTTPDVSAQIAMVEFMAPRESTKATWQHYGTKRDGRTAVPASPFFDIRSEKEKKACAEVVLEMVATNFKKQFSR